MKKTIVLILTLSILMGCRKEYPKPTLCSETVDLGLFTSSFAMPYDEFETIEYVSEAAGTATVAVNIPSAFSFYGIPKKSEESHSFDCEAFNSVEKFVWKTESKQTIFSLTLPQEGSQPVIMVKNFPIVDVSNPQSGAVGDFLEFYNNDELSGILNGTPFMRVMTKELQDGKGGDFETGYSYFGTFSIKGETFEQVYSNTENLSGDIANVYFNKTLGLIGFKDKEGVLWRVGG
ncbi:MAG: hypothetical protein GC192_15280 [Bacteroidetes bacterium]|nr:hypothetical protein [Bacteroidota bacterium]